MTLPSRIREACGVERFEVVNSKEAIRAAYDVMTKIGKLNEAQALMVIRALKNRNDAEEVITGISQQWNRTGGTILFSVVKLIPASKKWPKNSGPKRKPKTFIALAGKYKGQKVTERATPVELRARKDSQWITNPDGTTGTSLKAHLKPVKSTTKSGKR